jgi:hypothetical protein
MSHPTTFPSYLAVLLLCLAVVPVPADVPRSDNEEIALTCTPAAYTLATLTREQARQLEGRRAVYRIVRDDSAPDWDGTFDIYGCKGPKEGEPTVWLRGEEIDDEMTVSAVLLVIRHKEWISATGTRVEAWTEYRLTDARRCR